MTMHQSIVITLKSRHANMALHMVLPFFLGGSDKLPGSMVQCIGCCFKQNSEFCFFEILQLNWQEAPVLISATEPPIMQMH